MLSTVAGKCIMTFLISMVPVIELRGGLPYGIVSGLSLPAAAGCAIAGNILPVPFIIIFIERIFTWLRRMLPRIDSFISSLERRADSKKETIDKYGWLGLVILVAIPLPGTGAWTGALVAAMLEMKLKKAVPCILLGVVIAAVIMTVVTKLGIFAFF